MSTIAILKEVITKQATALKVQRLMSKRARQLRWCVGSFTRGTMFVVAFQISVNLPFEIKDETVPNFLRLIHPKLTYTLSLARKVDLIEALKEIKIQDTDMTFLAPEYSEVRHWPCVRVCDGDGVGSPTSRCCRV